MFARAAYGTTGANLPALMRALIACGWFGIGAWIGGKALQVLVVLVVSVYPGWRDLASTARSRARVTCCSKRWSRAPA